MSDLNLLVFYISPFEFLILLLKFVFKRLLFRTLKSSAG